MRRPPRFMLFPYTTLFRSISPAVAFRSIVLMGLDAIEAATRARSLALRPLVIGAACRATGRHAAAAPPAPPPKAKPNAARSEEHTSELQSHHDLVCRLLLE